MSTHKTRTKKTSRQKNEKEKVGIRLSTGKSWRIERELGKTTSTPKQLHRLLHPHYVRSPALTFKSQTTDNTTSDQRSDEDTDLIKLQSALCNVPSCVTCGKKC